MLCIQSYSLQLDCTVSGSLRVKDFFLKKCFFFSLRLKIGINSLT